MKDRKVFFVIYTILTFSATILAAVAAYKAEKVETGLTNIFWLLLASIILVLASVVMLLLSKNNFKRSIYISYNKSNRETAKMIMHRYRGVIFSSFYTIKPGNDIKNTMRSEIRNAAKCFVLIGESIDDTQKEEIKYMKNFNKKIIPFLVSNDAVIPSQLRGVKAIYPE